LLGLYRFDEAEEQCALVLAGHAAVDDVRVRASRRRALALAGLGRHQEAVDVLDAFLREAAPVLGADRPGVVDARIDRLNQLALLARYESVEQEWQELSGLLDVQDPRYGRAAGVRVYQLNSTSRHAEAETTARAALARHPHIALHAGFARSLNGQARHQEALDALATARTHPQAHLTASQVLVSTVTAEAHLGLGHLGQAEAQARHAVDTAAQAGLPPANHRAREAAATLTLVLTASATSSASPTTARTDGHSGQ
jgi:hypothetical protein